MMTLSDLKKIWLNPELSKKYQEFFSIEKLTYYLFRTCKAVRYLHTKNIYYGDVKAANILVFRNQQVKLGDLGIIVKLDNDND